MTSRAHDGAKFPVCFAPELASARDDFSKGRYDKCSEKLSAARDGGSVNALCTIALLRMTGSGGFKRDLGLAKQEIYSVAVGGNAFAQYLLSWLLVEEGRKLDAAEFMRTAAEAGFTPAMLDLARFHFDGYGVRRSIPDALTWASRARRSGHIMAHRLFLQYALTGRQGRLRRQLARIAYPFSTLYISLWGMFNGYLGERSLVYYYVAARPGQSQYDTISS